MAPPKIKFPEPSGEERALQGEQLSLLRGQRDILSRQLREQSLLMPFLYRGMGITPKMNEQGEIIGFDEDPTMAADQKRNRDIQSRFADRTLAALEGRLPVDPSLTRDLSQQEQDLKASLAAQLGPGAEASSLGQQALRDFGQRRTELLDASRRGDLTLAEGLGLARHAAGLQERQANMGGMMNISQLLGGTGAGYSSISGGLGGILQRMAGERSSRFQGMMAQPRGSAMGFLGNLGGMALGSFLGPFGAMAGGSAANSLFGSLGGGGSRGGGYNPYMMSPWGTSFST